MFCFGDWEDTYAVRCFSLWPLVSGSHLFAVCSDSGYMLRQFTAASVGDDFLDLLVFSALLGSTMAPGDDFVELSVLSTMLGSTVALEDAFFELFVFSAMLGSTVAPGDDLVNCSFFSACLVRQWLWEMTTLLWQRLVQGGFAGYDAFRAVFLSVRRSMIRGIMAVWTGRTVAGIAGFHALRAVFP